MYSIKWYQSKLVWLNIVNTLIGAGALLAEYLNKGDYSPAAVVLLVTGILGVVLRVYFSGTSIQ